MTPDGGADRPELRTYFCWVPRHGGNLATGEGGLYRAKSRGQARYLCLLNVRDAGWDIEFADIKVRREPGWDDARFRDGVMPRYAEARR